MATPMLKRRLNPFLLVSTVLILSLLAGLSVLYQGQINNMVEDQRQMKEKLNESRFKVKQIKSEKKILEKELRQKKSEIDRLESLLASKRKEIEKLAQRIKLLKNQLEDARSTDNTTSRLNDTLGTICGDKETTLSNDASDLCHFRGHDTS